jgi:predicted xylose isomerase-like sugar epimerase
MDYFAGDLGFKYVELRNDLAGKEILDDLPDDAVRQLLDVTKIGPLK